MTGYEKAKFRKSTAFRDFRDKVRGENLDELTLEPLKESFILHHIDLNPENYKDLEIKKFMGFNSSFEHRLVHYLYSKFIRDPGIINRLDSIIHKMVEINDYKDEHFYKNKKPRKEDK